MNAAPTIFPGSSLQKNELHPLGCLTAYIHDIMCVQVYILKTLLFKYVTLVYYTHEYKRTGHTCQGERNSETPANIVPYTFLCYTCTCMQNIRS